MKCFYLFSLILGLSLISTESFAARFWIAASASNWNNTANWSTLSGGAGGSSVPAAGDDVNFDNNGLGNCTIDATVAVKSITVAAGYTGTISQGANPMSTVNAASFSGGTFTGGSANITIGGGFTLSGTAFTSTTAVLELDNTIAAFTTATFTHNNGTVRLNSGAAQTFSGISPVFFTLEFVGTGNTYTLTSAGNFTVMNALNITGAQACTINTGTIDVKGDINSTNTNTGGGGTATVNINGTGVQNFNGSTIAGNGALPQLNINKILGSLNLANFPAVANNFTYTAGTVTPGTSTFCFTRGGAINAYTITGSLTLNNISFVLVNTVTATIAAATTLTTTGDFTIAGSGNAILNTGNINVNGNVNLTGTAAGGGGTATLNIVGAGSENLDGSTILVNQSRLPLVIINKAGGTLSLLGNISFSANVTYTAGTINPGTSTCYIVNNLTTTGNFSLNNLTISAAGNTNFVIAGGNTLTVNNTLDLESTNKFININTGTLAVQGNIIDNNTNTTGGGTGTILLNGSGAQTITTTGVTDQGRLPSVTINSTGGTVVFPSLLTVVGNWTYLSGTLDVLTNSSTVVFENTLTITGSHTLNNVNFNGTNNFAFTTAVGTVLTVSGTMNITGTNNVILTTGTINLNGNLVLTNTAVGGGGTTVIAFVSAGNQSIISALPVNQSNLPAVTINKPGGTLLFPALITVRGNWTYTAGTLDMATNNATVVFASPLGAGLFGITGTHTLNNVTFEGNNNNTATVNTGTILTVSGTLTTSGASNVFINTTIAGATAIQAQGNITIGNTSVAGGGTGVILINGAGAQLFSSTSAASQGILPAITIQKTTGTLTMSGIISESRNWTYSSGVVDATTNLSTVVFGGNNLSIASSGMSFYNVSFVANTSTLTNSLTVANNLTLSGLPVLAPGTNTINLGGNWSNWGTAGFNEATSTVNFNGSAMQTITTPGGENFTNMVVNNSGAGVQLFNNLTVATTMTMTKGNIDLNGGNGLTLGLSVANNGTLAYTAGSILGTGSFTRWFKAIAVADGSVTGLFPMGTAANNRLFFVSAPTTGPTTGGTIAVTYTDASTNTAVAFADGASTVMVRKDLNWALSTGNGLAGGTYDLEIQGTGFGTIGAVTDLRVTLVGSVVGLPGTNAGTTTTPQINRTGLTLANLSNSFFVGSINAINTPLPITLISFSAKLVGGGVDINWITAAEVNNAYFTIQRSRDANHWTNIRQIAGGGTRSTDSSYSAIDYDPFSGTSFYRLMQTDRDGKETYSEIVSIDLGNSTTIEIYPNPAVDHITINIPNSSRYKLSVLNGLGQLVYSAELIAGSRSTINVSTLQRGIYYFYLSDGNGLKDIRKIVLGK